VVVHYQGVMEALSWLLMLPYLISFAIGQRHIRNAYVTLSIVAGVGVGSSLFLAVLFGAIISLLSERCEGNDTPDCCGACLDQGALMNSHIFAFTPSRLTIFLYICFNIVSLSALHSLHQFSLARSSKSSSSSNGLPSAACVASSSAAYPLLTILCPH
jgi:hypothetical protein